MRADQPSFEAWLAPHWPAMRRLAERLAGSSHRDDVLQDALLAAWRHRDRFDPTRGSERSWLLAITANHARKSWRRRWSAVEPEPVIDRTSEADIDVQRAIAALAPRQRLAIELFYFVALPVRDVADAMGITEGTAKATLSAARARLRVTLGEDYL